MILTLDENHVYHVDSRPVPISVTGLLKFAGLIDDTWFTEYARQRGKLTHLAIKYHNDGELDESSLDPAIEPYFGAYVKFLVDSGFVVTGSEIPVYSEEWDYAGTQDLEGFFLRSPDIPCSADTKTGKVQDWTQDQISLYDRARGVYRRRFALELHRNGRYKIIMYDWWQNKQADARTLQLLKRWREEHGTSSAAD